MKWGIIVCYLMKKLLLTLCFIFALSPALAQRKSWDGIHLSTLAEVKANLKNPPADYANHVIWGIGGPMTHDVICQDLDSIKSKGFKSVIIEAGYRLPAPYLSEEYFKLIRNIVLEAKKRNLKIWIIDEGKYPSGFAGGKFSRERPDLRMQALVKCGEINVKPGEIIKDKLLPDYVMSTETISSSGQQNISVPVIDHKISFNPGMDSWSIILVRSDFRTGQTRSIDSPTGAKDTRNSQMDYLNPEAVKQFINWTHEGYKKYIGREFGKTVMGFRGDEPDYSHIPFTPDIIENFKQLKGYDPTPCLASFFTPVMTDKEKQVKADYWDVWSQRFANTYFKTESEWCEKNGLAHITHLNNDHDMPACVRNEGDFFRNLRRVTIPGIDAIWNQIWPDTINDFPKYASSVAHVYGKPRAFSESFAAYYNSPTIPQAKYVIDYQMARGINFFEYMFWSAGSKHPNWMTAPGMKGLNEYSNRMSYLLSQGKPGARVAVYYPVSTLWMGNDEIAERIKKIAHQLLLHHVDFDYITDDAFKEALSIGREYLENKSGQQYKTVIIPSSDILSAAADSSLREFVTRGGKVLFWGSTPYYIYGKSFTQLKPFEKYDKSWSESTDAWTATVAAAMPAAEVIIRNKLPLEQRERKKAGEHRPKPVDGTIDIRYQHRVLADADLYFIFNEGHRNQSFSAGFDAIGKAELIDADNGISRNMDYYVKDNRTWVDINLKEWETVTLVIKHNNRQYRITDNGAIGDENTVCTQAIQTTIDKAYHDGGGTVIIPSGRYLTGAIFFKPGVNLHIDKGAALISTLRNEDFEPVITRFEGKEQLWKPALLNFTDCKNVRIDGEGTIDGQGVAWKNVNKREDFFKTYGRPRLLCFTRCNGGSISGIHLKDQASWCLHILYTDSFTVDGVDIRAEHTIPSSDGIDIDSSSRILVQNTYIEDNDDCISIKSGKDEEGRRIHHPSEDITIRNCRFGYGHSGVDIGSEVSGDIRNILVENCIMEEGNRGAVRIKSQPSRGGIIENITCRNIKLKNSESFLDINLRWRMVGELAPDAPVKTQLRNILIENVTGRCKDMGRIIGYDSKPLEGIRIINCKIKAENTPSPEITQYLF